MVADVVNTTISRVTWELGLQAWLRDIVLIEVGRGATVDGALSPTGILDCLNGERSWAAGCIFLLIVTNRFGLPLL